MQTKVREMRERAGLSQRQLAEKMKVSQQSIYYYESGDRDIKASVLVDMSRILNCTVSELLGLGRSDMVRSSASTTFSMPLVARISAGTPNEAIAQSEQSFETTEQIYASHPKGFWMKVSGNSMNRLFPDGAVILVDPDQEVRNGDVGVVFVNGYDATVKRIYLEDDVVRLHPESYDPEYADRVIDSNDPDAPDVRIVGKVVSYAAPSGWRA